MSKIIESNYQGKYNTSTKTPLGDDIKVDLKFGPIDILMGAYGSCMLGTVDFYARKNGFEVNGSKSEISYEIAAEGGQVGIINVKLSFDKTYPEDQKEIIETAAKNFCHVGNSLNPSIVRNYEFVYEA